jgi:hypothetical protein
MAKHKFEKGNPGKPKGAKTKLSESFYADCLAAYNDPRVGGLEGLISFIRANSHNRMTFYAWLSKTIPTNMAVTGGDGKGPVAVNVKVTFVDTKG